MIKVALFSVNHPEIIEEEVNAWLINVKSKFQVLDLQYVLASDGRVSVMATYDDIRIIDDVNLPRYR